MDPIVISGLVNLGYLALGLVIARGLLLYGNRSGVTGQKFTLHGWLDAIDGTPVAMAIVVAGLLLSFAIIISAFIHS